MLGFVCFSHLSRLTSPLYRGQHTSAVSFFWPLPSGYAWLVSAMLSFLTVVFLWESSYNPLETCERDPGTLGITVTREAFGW